MISKRRLLPAVVVSGSSIVVGCGGHSGSCSSGGYGSYSCAPNPGNADPSGIYEGTLTDPATQTQTPVIALIAETGEGRVSGADGTYYRINVGTMGSGINGSYTAYSSGTPLPDGGTSDVGSLSGGVTQNGLDVTLTDQKGDIQDLSLNFDNTYNIPSSLPTLAGTWSSSVGSYSLSVSIQSNGVFTGTDSNGCTYSGSFGLIDTSFNAYSENYTVSCSSGSDTFSGLSNYVPASGAGTNASPPQIQIYADDGAGNFLVSDLNPS